MNYYSNVIGLDGREVERTKEEYPYSYDTFIVWQSKNYKSNDTSNHTVYSDRLFQWNAEKYNDCCKTIWNNHDQYFDDRKPDEIENFLCMYLDKKIELLCIAEGCNHSSGYPFWLFVYREN